jgi:ABC-type multidrug transport system ATPase subunit
LDALGVSRLEKRKLPTLELPERRVVLLAQAALGSPAVLLVDHALDGLHDGAAEWVRAVLDRAGKGRRLIFTASAALPLGETDRFLRTLDELVVLVNGSVVRRGAPSTVLAPGTRYLITVRGTPEALLDALGERGIAAEWARASDDASIAYHRVVADLPEGTSTATLLEVAVALNLTIVELVPLLGPMG